MNTGLSCFQTIWTGYGRDEPVSNRTSDDEDDGFSGDDGNNEVSFSHPFLCLHRRRLFSMLL